jgi:hypothetical protein
MLDWFVTHLHRQAFDLGMPDKELEQGKSVVHAYIQSTQLLLLDGAGMRASLTYIHARFRFVSLNVEITYVNVIVTDSQWESEGLAKIPVYAVHRPEDTLTKLYVFFREAGVPHWAAMQSNLKCHSHYETPESRRSIMAEHWYEEELHADNRL